MNKKDILKKIKRRGHWRIHFSSTEKLPPLTYSECEEVLKRTQVKLRGWYFPHFYYNELKRIEKGMSAVSEHGEFIEAFTLSLNRKFSDYVALHEDWLEQAKFYDRNRHKKGEALDFINALYFSTEIFEFCARLTSEGVFGQGVNITLGLFGLKKRKIISWDPRRIIHGHYVCESEKIEKSYTLTKTQILTNAEDLAIDYVRHVFGLFQWTNITDDTLKSAQKELLKRR